MFAVPLERFLRVRYGADVDRADPESVDGVPWYSGSWVPWNGTKWKYYHHYPSSILAWGYNVLCVGCGG